MGTIAFRFPKLYRRCGQVSNSECGPGLSSRLVPTGHPSMHALGRSSCREQVRFGGLDKQRLEVATTNGTPAERSYSAAHAVMHKLGLQGSWGRILPGAPNFDVSSMACERQFAGHFFALCHWTHIRPRIAHFAKKRLGAIAAEIWTRRPCTFTWIPSKPDRIGCCQQRRPDTQAEKIAAGVENGGVRTTTRRWMSHAGIGPARRPWI
jgi:hypothetical protein